MFYAEKCDFPTVSVCLITARGELREIQWKLDDNGSALCIKRGKSCKKQGFSSFLHFGRALGIVQSFSIKTIDFGLHRLRFWLQRTGIKKITLWMQGPSCENISTSSGQSNGRRFKKSKIYSEKNLSTIALQKSSCQNAFACTFFNTN